MMNIFDLSNLTADEEMVTVLAESSNVRIERIVSRGQTSGWYDQEESEWVTLLAGRAALEYADGKTVELTGGDTLLIKPHEKHRVAYTSSLPPCVWLCVFF